MYAWGGLMASSLSLSWPSNRLVVVAFRPGYQYTYVYTIYMYIYMYIYIYIYIAYIQIDKQIDSQIDIYIQTDRQGKCIH